VYLAYTYGTWGNIRERMVRYEYDGSNLVNPLTIVEDLPGNTTHIGCRLLALPDNTLLMTTGDAQNITFCQDVSSWNGKVLRFNLDGTIPADNPIAGSPVYSWGHRNAQGLAYHNGIIYCSEHGPSNDDEFHIIEAGRNYGWPNVEGLCDLPNETTFCNDSSVVEPLAVWTPTIAPSDIIWYDHPSIPEWQNTILMTLLKDKNLVKIDFNAAGDQIESMQAYFTNQFNRLRDICVSPTGAVYLATNGSSWQNNNPFSHSIVKVWNDSFMQVGLTETAQPSFTVMPNPATEYVRLAFTPNLVGGELFVYAITGELVQHKRITQGQLLLDRGAWPAGTYIVRAHSGQQLVTQKLVLR